MPSTHRHLAAILLTALLSACRATGPEIPRYVPAAPSASQEVTSWSEDVWRSARAGDRGRVDELLEEAPLADSTADRLEARLQDLDDRAYESRAAICNRALDELAQAEPGSSGDARALATLASLCALESPSTLQSSVDAALDIGIERWNAMALDAEAANDLEAAIDAWAMVELIAGDGRHVALQNQAMDRTSRLTGRRPGAGRSDPLPPRVVADSLDLVLKEHVDRLDVAALAQSGFAALDQAAHAVDPEAGRDRDVATVARIKAEFDASQTDGLPGVLSLRGLDRATRRGIEQASKELAQARDRGVFSESMADPIRVFLDGMLEQTDIRTRAFLGDDAETLRRALGGSFVGIGIRFSLHPDGLLMTPLPGGPSRKAGIRTGDILLAIDGIEVDDLTMEQLVAAASGRRGTTVDLKIRRANTGEHESIVVVRDTIEIESVHGWRQKGVDSSGRPIWDWIVDPEAAIAFVSIRDFEPDTDRLFREAMLEADRAVGPDRLVQGLILDLREDPGGDRLATERLLDLFLNDGTVFRAVGDSPLDDMTLATIASTRLAGLPVVVLVSGHSASASELVAGTLQGAADAVVVGDRTFGKGSVQAVHTVRNGFLAITQSWFLVPTNQHGDHRLIDRARAFDWGIEPNLRVAALPDELTAALIERSEWVSSVGRDVGDPEAASTTLENSEDRGLLTAVLLLRARLLPTFAASLTDQ